MKTAKLEQVSSLVDGEHDGDFRSPIDHLLKDPELRHAWQRYHELGDWMRGAADGDSTRVDVAARVSGALESEPVLLFPDNRSPVVTDHPRRHWWGQFVGMGIAAAVASVTVLLFQQAGSPQAIGEPTVIAIAADSADQAASNGVRLIETGQNRVALVDAERAIQPAVDSLLAEQALEQKLDAYLASHVKQSTGLRIPGLLPSIRTVDYGAAQQAQ